MAQKTLTYSDILKQIQLKQFAPIYVLMGDEPYFIDKIVDALEKGVLTEEEKDMNLTIRYGNDQKTNAQSDIIGLIINDAQRYPMLSDYQLVILKEAQNVDKKDVFDKLQYYLEKPQPNTILVIAYKYGSIDKRKKWINMAAKLGVVFESKKLYENQVHEFINQQATLRKLSIEPEAACLLTEWVGTDLSQMESILEKFNILLTDKRRITPEVIEKNIGISKDYTAFELQNALIERDIEKANRIILHTSSAIQMIISVLFGYFANLMVYEYLPSKKYDDVIAQMHIAPFMVKKYEMGARAFTKMQTYKIIGYLREYDGKSKGIGNASASDVDLLKELIYKILH